MASYNIAGDRLAYTSIGPDHCGYYIDAFRKVGERWLIAHRKVRLDWRSPQSLFATVISDTRCAAGKPG